MTWGHLIRPAHIASASTPLQPRISVRDPALCTVISDVEGRHGEPFYARVGGVDDIDLTQLQLDVYMTREGPWNPDHGEIEIPDEWDFLPSGDAFVTRRVKASGTYWVAWRPRGRNRPHRRRLGLWAPKQAIETAWTEAAATEGQRAKQREQGRDTGEAGGRLPR